MSLVKRRNSDGRQSALRYRSASLRAIRPHCTCRRRFDYQTQLDRINNWINFGNWIMQRKSDLITKQEVNGLVITFYNVIREMYFEHKSDCKRDGIIELAKIHIHKIIGFSGFSRLSKELKLFLFHTNLWEICIIPKIFFERRKNK